MSSSSSSSSSHGKMASKIASASDNTNEMEDLFNQPFGGEAKSSPPPSKNPFAKTPQESLDSAKKSVSLKTRPATIQEHTPTRSDSEPVESKSTKEYSLSHVRAQFDRMEEDAKERARKQSVLLEDMSNLVHQIKRVVGGMFSTQEDTLNQVGALTKKVVTTDLTIHTIKEMTAANEERLKGISSSVIRLESGSSRASAAPVVPVPVAEVKKKTAPIVATPGVSAAHVPASSTVVIDLTPNTAAAKKKRAPRAPAGSKKKTADKPATSKGKSRKKPAAKAEPRAPSGRAKKPVAPEDTKDGGDSADESDDSDFSGDDAGGAQSDDGTHSEVASEDETPAPSKKTASAGKNKRKNKVSESESESENEEDRTLAEAIAAATEQSMKGSSSSKKAKYSMDDM